MYRIRRKSDGLFSAGGGYARFTKNGKVWRTMGQLKNHINFSNYRDLDALEVVEMEMTEKGVQPLRELVEAQKENQRVKQQESREAGRRRVEQAERKLLRELAAKYEKGA